MPTLSPGRVAVRSSRIPRQLIALPIFLGHRRKSRKAANKGIHDIEIEVGTYRFYDPALSAGVLERLLMEQALRGALANHQLLLHYQPQVDLYPDFDSCPD
jgi:hypothetical protein